jgi:LysM repeat protein
MYTNATQKPNWTARLLSSLVILALLLAAMPQQALAATNVTCSQYYSVQSGETLTAIAAKFNVTLTELANANNLKDPYVIFVGQQLCIPSSSTTSTTTTTTTSSKTGFTVTSKDFKTIVVTITNFPKKVVYIVKGRNGYRGHDEWFKIGRVKTTKTGSNTVTLRLPKELRGKDYMQICLKNAITDAVTCQYFRP